MKIQRYNPFLRFFRHLFATSAIVMSFFTAASSQAAQVFLDTNGSATGFGDFSGVWDQDPIWSTAFSGNQPTSTWVDGDSALFNNNGDGTLTIQGTVATPSITFLMGAAQTVTGGTLNISPSNGLAIDSSAIMATGSTKTIASKITGTGGLTITAAGDLSPTGGANNTRLQLSSTTSDFIGDITITNGLLSWTNPQALGNAANNLIIQGGGILAPEPQTIARNLSVAGPTGTIRLYGIATVDFNGTISSTAPGVTLSHTDGGTLILNGDGSGFDGVFAHQGGVTRFVSPDWSNTDIDATTAGQIQFTNTATTEVRTITTTRDIVINNGTVLDIVSGTLNLGEAGLWVKSDAGTGYLTSSSGELFITNGQSSGALTTTDHQIQVVIKDLNGSTPLVLEKNNMNSLVLTRTNTYTGGTFVTGGSLNATNLNAFGTGAVTAELGGQIRLQAAGAFANNFVIEGFGANSEGALRLNGGSNISGQVTLAGPASIGAAGTSTISGAVTSAATDELEINGATIAGTLTLADASGVLGGIYVRGGTLNVANVGSGVDVATAGTLNVTGTVAGDIEQAGASTVRVRNGGQVANATFLDGATRNFTLEAGGTVTGDLITTPSAPVALQLNGAVTGNVRVDDGSTLSTNGGTVGGNLEVGFDTNSNIAWDVSAALDVTGNVVLNGTQTINLLKTPEIGQPFVILSYDGTLTGSASNFQLANQAGFRNAAITNTGSEIAVTMDVASRTWAGNHPTNPTFWNAAITPNWTGGDSLFYNGDTALFNDAAATTTVAIQGTVAPGHIVFNNTAKEYTVTGPGFIIGGADIVKSGTGRVTLGGGDGQSFTGPISVNAGTLRMASRDAFGRAASITVAAGATVDINGQTPGTLATGGYAYTISGNGVGGVGAITNTGAASVGNGGIRSLTLAGNASVGGTGRYDIGYSLNAGYGTVTGNGNTLTKVGSNTVLMRADASASPINFVVNEGVLLAQTSANAFGGANGTVQVNTGARVSTFGPLTITTPVTINNGGILSNGGDGAGQWTNVTLKDGANIETPANWVFLAGTAVHDGSGAIIKTGANELKITGNLTSSGGILNHNEGTIEIGNSTANGSISGFSQINIAPGMLFRSRLNGANNSIASNFDFAGPASELRQHGVNPTDTLTLTGTIGDDPTTGRIGVHGGNLVLPVGAPVVVNDFSLGARTAGQQAYLTIGTGAAVTTRYFNIGDAGGAQFVVNQTGGNVTILDGAAGFRVGHWSGANRQYNLSGGTLNALGISANAGENRWVNIGWDGQGLMTVGGGASEALLQAAGLRFDRNRGNVAGGGANSLTILPNGVVEVASLGTEGNGPNDFIVLNGGTIRGTQTATWTSNIQVASESTVDASANVRINQTGPVTGSEDILVTGSGAVGFTNLTGYTGTLKSTSGNLYLSGMVHDIEVAQAGALRIGPVASTGSTGTLTINGSALIDGSVYFDLDATNPNAPGQDFVRVETTGDVTFGPNAVIRPSFFGGTLAAGEYPIFGVDGTRTGMPTVDPGSVRFTLALEGGQGQFVNDVVLVVSGEAGNLVWDGDGTANVWDLNSTENWLLEGAPAKFLNYDAVNFTDAGDNSVPIQIQGTLNPSVITVNGTKDYTFAGTGSLVGSTVTKEGTSTLTVNNANTLGALTLTGGAIVVNETGSLGATGTITTAENTQVELNKTGDANFGRVISGAGSLVKSGSGIVRITAKQEFTGNTTVEGGVLSLSGGGGASGTIRGKVDVLAGASLRLNTGDATGWAGGAAALTEINLIGGNMHNNTDSVVAGVNQTLGSAIVNMTGATITGAANSSMDFFGGGSALNTLASDTTSVISGTHVVLRQTQGVTFTVAQGTTPSGVDLEISSRLTNIGSASNYGNHPLIKAGLGTLKITGTENNYTGHTTVNAGTLDLTTGNVYTGAHASFAIVTVKSGATLKLKGMGYNVTPGSIASLGALRNQANARVLDGGTMVVTHGTESVGNNFTVTSTGGTLRYQPVDTANTLTLTGNENGNIPVNGALTLDAVGNITIQEVLEGTGSIVKTGAGKLTIESASTFVGNLTVSEGAFELAPTGSLVFNVTGSGVSKTITGAGSATFNGTFIVDLTNAPTTEGSSWVLANVANQTFGSSFSLSSGGTPFTESAGVHTFVNGSTTYTFTEATGVLSIGEGGSATGFEGWAAQITDPNQRGRGDDPDGDGFTNLQEYLFGSDPSANNGSLVTSAREGNNLVIRWNQLNAGGSYQLQESGTLMGGSWTLSAAVPAADSNQAGVPAEYTRMKATVPITGSKRFFRVEGDEN